MTKGNDTLLFYYDSDGNVTSFKYGDTMYYYVKNLQGDVVKIINQSGTVFASYVYDAWGNIKSVKGALNLRELNTFRYRMKQACIILRADTMTRKQEDL